MMNSPPRPTEAELEILTVLWDRGPSTVREVHDVIVQRRPAQYTTVLKMLQIMAEKGLVRRDAKQRLHIYQPALPRDLLKRAFEGSALPARSRKRRRLFRFPHSL